MENIEIGEYVRTNTGLILKYDDENEKAFIDNFLTCSKNYERIVKHNKQLINLIEVRDIVEIFDVLHEDIIYIWSEEMLKALKEDVENGIQIRRILTKEQIEANCYKVGGEDE